MLTDGDAAGGEDALPTNHRGTHRMNTKLIRSLGGNSNSPTDLLDRFAEAALAGLVSDPNTAAASPLTAQLAYEAAANMVRARLQKITELAVEAGYTAHEPGKPTPLPSHTPVELVLPSGQTVRVYTGDPVMGYDFVAYRDMSRPMAEGA